MILENESMATPIIYGICCVLFVILIPMIINKLTTPKFVKERLKQKKKCTAKTTGRILEVHGTAPPEFRQDPGSWPGGNRTKVFYEYYINGVRYTGHDEIFISLAAIGGTVNILYDPQNPSISCTPYGRKVDNGTNHIIPILIVLGVIAFIILFLILASVALGSRFR